MRHVDVIRHARRPSGAEHLSDEGVAMARQVGDQLGPYKIVGATGAARAIETAVAMGFAVHEEQPLPRMRKFEEGADWEAHIAAGFPEMARLYKEGEQTMRFAETQAGMWMDIAERLDEEEMGLVISHQGSMEIGAIGALPHAEHKAWGGLFGYCEGIRLVFDGGKFSGGEIIRVTTDEDGKHIIVTHKAA